jgi:hypothetical protein
MEDKLTVFSEKLDCEVEVCVSESAATDQDSDWSCWVDAGWGNG